MKLIFDTDVTLLSLLPSVKKSGRMPRTEKEEQKETEKTERPKRSSKPVPVLKNLKKLMQPCTALLPDKTKILRFLKKRLGAQTRRR